MTAVQPPLEPGAPEAESTEELSKLSDFLPPRCFPCTRDGLSAILARSHAPTRLLWELARLSPSRVYEDVEQVRAAVEQAVEPASPPEPI